MSLEVRPEIVERLRKSVETGRLLTLDEARRRVMSDTTEARKMLASLERMETELGQAPVAGIPLLRYAIAATEALEAADTKLGSSGQDGTCGFHEDTPERVELRQALADWVKLWRKEEAHD